MATSFKDETEKYSSQTRLLRLPIGPWWDMREGSHANGDFVVSEGRSKLLEAVTVPASSGWQRLVWLAPRRQVRCR